jgi:hypothetical protein
MFEGRVSRVVCNPVDLPYRYQQIKPLFAGSRMVHREGADPSVVRYRDRYFMFVSMSRGFFHSEDLVTWAYQPTESLPALDYAPDVRVVDDRLIICASRNLRKGPFFESADPLADDFTLVTKGTFRFFDPNVFQDDDGQVYLYQGCSATQPITVSKLDRNTFARVGDSVQLLAADTSTRGWERTGEDFVAPEPNNLFEKALGDRPFVEGSWMTKHGDTYYLQYGAPGTQWNTYADGYATSKSPMGPFEYSRHSPFSSKPGGFIPGAGHGSTFQDIHGNWWHTATMRISVNNMFERRVGLFPAGFDDDGVLFCNQNFGDYPMNIPAGRFDPWGDAFAGWMLQSYRKAVETSSSAVGHPGELAVNEDIRSWWVAGSSNPGEWLTVDLGSVRTVHALQVNHGDDEAATRAPRRASTGMVGGVMRAIYPELHPTEVLVEASVDGEVWVVVDDTRGTGADAPHRFVVLPDAVEARYVRITGGAMPFGGPLTISGLRVFGTRDGEPPAAVVPTANRVDPLSAEVEWAPVEGAQGYNVRYGIAPDALYHSWLIYDQASLRIPTLNAGMDYWIAVDSFGETGITAGRPVQV